jgi:hypothetical protein
MSKLLSELATTYSNLKYEQKAVARDSYISCISMTTNKSNGNNTLPLLPCLVAIWGLEMYSCTPEPFEAVVSQINILNHLEGSDTQVILSSELMSIPIIAFRYLLYA